MTWAVLGSSMYVYCTSAMTPCSLFKLRRKDLEVVVNVYPDIRRALEKENNRRHQENVNSAMPSAAIRFIARMSQLLPASAKLEKFSKV